MELTLKDILDSLPDSDRATLMYAFEQELPQYVKIPGSQNRYVGVYVKSIPNLHREKEIGAWSTGTILKEIQ